ncbi:hypothetical protein [Nocardioides iriomotensis]|uniref:ScoMcrA-like N-terminal head domain-containing protein n=1 Tax=Nocardioides iriomotensis TaxID=715784 RepID=A0A4Q5IWX5_9ACTN|nr:hypothetical protein [Nocardioides iriomotensis]RYU09698.1 hypothetical protein ETU37_22000 [Nocardioides iriomotensis]
MPDWSLVARSHVAAVLAEGVRLGPSEFLARYRFRRAKASTLWYGGQEFDPIAVLGVAYVQASGRGVDAADLDEPAAAQVLKTLGFDVVVDEDAMANLPRPTRRASSSTGSSGSGGSGRASGSASSGAAKTPRAPRATRTAAPAAPKRAKPADAPAKICPTCFMALPATGICDNCD